MRDIGKNIRSLRLEQNMTQQELADRLFVTRQTVSNYESCRSHPDVEMLVQMAEVFQVDVSVLIYGKPLAPDRKRQLKRLFLPLGICVLLILGSTLLGPWGQYLKRAHFLAGVPILIQFFLTIPAVFLAGWCAMQGLSLCTQLRPLDKPWVAGVRLAYLILLGLVVVLALPYVIYMAVMTVWSLQRTSIDSTFPSVPMPIYTTVLRFLLVNVINNPYLFFPLGAGLWLLNFPKWMKTPIA